MYCAPTGGKSGGSGAEEDGFALESSDGDEDGYSGVDAGGGKDRRDRTPVVGACDDFLADKAGVEDGNEGELGVEFDAREDAGNGGDDDDKRHGCEIALGFFVGFGEEGDGHQDSGEEDGERQSHQEDGDDRGEAEIHMNASTGSIGGIREGVPHV